MKNQYFADVNDYTKYCILRQFYDVPKIVYWMLTKDDNRPDGRKLKYLKSERSAKLDKELWEHLSACVSKDRRDVSCIEGWLGNELHYEKRNIDDWEKREVISNEVISMVRKNHIVFLDPDNGYQVPSYPEGISRSSKYVYASEIRKLLERDAIIILFQHLRMGQTVADMVQQFSEEWKEQYRFAVRTSHVVYYFLSNSDLDWAINRLEARSNNLPHTRLGLLC